MRTSSYRLDYRLLFLALMLSVSASAATTRYVDDTYQITNDVGPAGLSNGDTVTFAPGEPGQTTGLTFGVNAFNSIASALTASANGDTIQVARGNYTLSAAILITVSVTINGPQAGVDPRPSAGTTRVIGSANEAIIDANGLASAFSIQADNVTIDGFDIKNAITALIDSPGTAVLTNAHIRNNVVHNTTTSGAARGIRLLAVTSSTVELNNVFTVADTGIEFGATATGASVNGIAQNNEVHDLGSAGTTNSAIYFYATPSTASLNATIKGNLVYNHFGNDAVKLGAKNGQDRLVSGGSILDNVVHDTAQDGISIETASTLVTRNEVYHSFSTNGAIFVEHAASSVTLTNNYVHDNSTGTAAILIGFSGRPSSPTNMIVNFNNIQNNTSNFIFLSDITGGTATLDASCNWVGSSASGTVAAAFKSTAGAVTTTNRIDFTPWLNSGTDTDGVTAGFQPDFSSLSVAPSTVSLQTGGTGRIQEGINLATSGGVLTVIAGNFFEDVNVNKSVSVQLQASTNVTGKINGTTGTIKALGSITLGDGSSSGISMSTNLDANGQTVTLLDSDGATLNGATSLGGGTLNSANGINIGGALNGPGSTGDTVTIANSASITPDVAIGGTLSMGPLNLNNASVLNYDIGTPGDKIDVTGALQLNGVLNITAASGFAGGRYVLITYSGALSGTTLSFGSTPPSFKYTIDTSVGNEVALVITPTITPGGPTTFCAGGSVTLTSSSATGNVWSLNSNPIGGATNQTYVATASGSYTVSANGSPSSAAIVVTVNPIPAAPTSTPSGPTTFCAGGSVTLTSSAATGNQWFLNGNPIGGATNQTYVATASGNYTVVDTALGCSSSASAATVVTVNPIPAAPTITPGGPTTFCVGGSVTLTSSAASGNQWYLNGNPIGGETNQTYVATASGNYTVVDTALGCSSSSSVTTTVTVNPIPAAPTITPGGPTTFCSGGSVTLTSSVATGNQWFLNGNPIGGATNQTYVATASGNYTVVDTALGCSSSASAATVVTVNPTPAAPTITPGGPTTFCAGGSVTLTSSAASGNQWYLNGNPIGGATNQTYVVTASGDYTVVDTALGCASSASAITTVTINPIPAAPTIAPGGPTTFGFGGSVSLASSSATGNQWYRDGNPIVGATGTNYSATATGNYTVVDTALGCSSASSAATAVTVLPVFTSNPTANPNPATKDSPVQFSAAIAPTDASLSWNFGDGSPAVIGAAPVHTFTSVAIFTITVTATDIHTNTTSTSALSLAVNATPILPTAPIFSTTSLAAPNPAISNLAVQFSVVVTPSDATVKWNFGDQSAPVSGATPTHIFTTGGVYTVTVTATDIHTGSTTTYAFSLTVADASTLPGTTPPHAVKGSLHFKPGADRVKLTGLLALKSSPIIGGTVLTLDIGGLALLVTLDNHGSGFDKGAKIKASVGKKLADQGPGLKFTVQVKGSLKAAISAGATVDANGNPVKLLVKAGYGGTAYSAAIPLTFKKNNATINFAP